VHSSAPPASAGRLLENLRQGRALLIQQCEECLLLEGLKKEFAGETELEQLLQTARKFEEQKRATGHRQDRPGLT
jgi:hypothetical protein